MKREQDNVNLANMLKASEARCEELEKALKTIHVWASCDDSSPQSRKKAMDDIIKLSNAVFCKNN